MIQIYFACFLLIVDNTWKGNKMWKSIRKALHSPFTISRIVRRSCRCGCVAKVGSNLLKLRGCSAELPGTSHRLRRRAVAAGLELLSDWRVVAPGPPRSVMFSCLASISAEAMGWGTRLGKWLRWVAVVCGLDRDPGGRGAGGSAAVSAHAGLPRAVPPLERHPLPAGGGWWMELSVLNHWGFISLPVLP